MRLKSNFDQETLRLLKQTLEDATEALPAGERTQETKAVLASRILELAADGERDPVRLSAGALLHLPSLSCAKSEHEVSSADEPVECRQCGSAMLIAFREPNRFRSNGGEIREYRCPRCHSRMTSEWPRRR